MLKRSFNEIQRQLDVIFPQKRNDSKTYSQNQRAVTLAVLGQYNIANNM